jgi:hypothetical protein
MSKQFREQQARARLRRGEGGSRRCEAIIEDFVNGKSYSGLRQPTTVPLHRECRFEAKKKLGRLRLCSRHVAMALDGFLAPTGEVTPRTDRANYQRGFVPGRPERWAQGLTPVEIEQ